MKHAGLIAALPMYDFPKREHAHASFWVALGMQLTKLGVPDVPARLTRHLHHETLWAHPRLLLGQACEYPLSRPGTTQVRLVGHPRYRVQGCAGASYRSAIVVRATDAAQRLADLKGRRCVVNEPTSNSGMNLLRATLAPIADGQPLFASVVVSGSHRGSIDAVLRGTADVAAIDCVTLAHVLRDDPAAREGLRILEWTPSSPSLPFITSAGSSDALLQTLRVALRALNDDPVAELLRDELFLDGFDLEPVEGYPRVLELEHSAARLGYAQLH